MTQAVRPTPTDDDVGQLSPNELQMIKLMRKLRPQSAFNVDQGLAVSQAKGVTGVLVFTIPAAPADAVDVMWVGGHGLGLSIQLP